ncbi:MAG: hypothetical protein KGJ78_13745 [Alphaproteobacteria bacterium]|nr:hypothetical protein [Alphaproteobacteria bacterium]
MAARKKTRSRKPGVPPVAKYLGAIPNRLQLAGGWIDQPFVSKLNPKPPGSMVVVQIEPNFRPMCRSGIASSTRIVANDLWHGRLPDRPKDVLVRELYHAENTYKAEPSGSQDMIGIIYPGINRLDYDVKHEGGVFPVHIESCQSHRVARWLEKVLHLIPIESRPEGYNPLIEKNLDPKWVARLGQSGKDTYDAIVRMDAPALGRAMNLGLKCWDVLLPQSMRHKVIKVDIMGLAAAYQQQYLGAAYSGPGGGYLIVVAEEQVPGSFTVNIRTE